MMAGHMGGGIGSTLLLGWPLSDWAALLLLFVVSVLTIVLVGAVIGVVANWFARPASRRDSTVQQRSGEEPTR